MGRPKAWLPFGSERLLQRVVRLTGTVARPIVVVAAPDQDLPELPADVSIVRDPVEGRGPLQGLATGLAALPKPVELVYATAIDVPFMEPRWITRLVELIDAHDLAIPMIGEQYHPLAALYRREAVVPVIHRMLNEDRLKLQRIVELVLSRIVRESEMIPVDPLLGTLRNLNHPEDYEQALRQVGLGGD
jgi:molybdopterin-guanine dinucleotide biosynthesis protein A